MAKDPAFLFYHQDFFTGVCDMTNEEVGAYIRCLCVQASKGGISEKHMKNICNSHEVHNSVKSKFIFDAEANIFFNERLKSEIEKRKKEVQTMTTYNGVNDPYASTFGGSSLMEHNKNFSSGTLFSNDGMGYTDLRQAYVESVIPVTEEDYKKMPKFRNIEEYKMHRNTVDVTPVDKTVAMRQLYNQNKEMESESAALAFHYAKQSEKAKANQESFWSGLKQVTNW